MHTPFAVRAFGQEIYRLGFNSYVILIDVRHVEPGMKTTGIGLGTESPHLPGPLSMDALPLQV